MKQRDIKPCLLCGKGVMHSNQLTFYRLRVEHMVCNLPAIRRQAGLEMMMGGNALIANVMGPDEDMAKPVCEPETIVVCQECGMMKDTPVAVMLEIAAQCEDPPK